MTTYTGREIKAALDRQAARLTRPDGPGTWTADHSYMTDDEREAYVARLVKDRLLPTDPKLVWRPSVDRSVVVRRDAPMAIGSGNVFEDLGFDDAEERLAGADARIAAERSDPTAPNYRVSIRVGDIPQEHMDAMLADMRERAARADGFILDKIASWPETWIAGYRGTVLGHGPTREAAVEDALDFANADPNQASKLELLQMTTGLSKLLGIVPLEYVVRNGLADVP